MLIFNTWYQHKFMSDFHQYRPRIRSVNYFEVYKRANLTPENSFDSSLKILLERLDKLESADSKTKPADMKDFTGEPAT